MKQRVSVYFRLFILLLLQLTAEHVYGSETEIFETLIISETKPAIDFPVNAPLNRTEFDRNAIQELGFSRAQDIANFVPNYNLVDSGANGWADRSNIRGLMNAPLYTSPAVVMYVDDIPYLSSFVSANQLLDTASIDVYRGPQQGVFGKNSYAGVVDVKSVRPTNQWRGSTSISKGNFDALKTDSHLSGAIIEDQLYFSIAGAYSKRDGYLRNTVFNSNPDVQDHVSGGLSLLWTPDSHWELDFRANLLDFDDGGIRAVSLGSNDIYQTQSTDPQTLNQSANSQSLKLSYIGNLFDLRSVTSRRNAESSHTIDFDFSPLPLFNQRSVLEQKQWSQEFHFRSLKDADWRGSFGLFFANNEVSGSLKNTTLQGTELTQLKNRSEESYAIFGQLGYHGLDTVRIFLDIRLDYVKYAIDSAALGFNGQIRALNDNNDDLFASPKLTLEYVFSEQLNAYVSSGLAFKPGGFTAQSRAFPRYQKETMWASEFGVKSSWFNNQLTADFSLFYYDINDYQLEEAYTLFDYTVINAPGVESYGAEVNISAQLTETLQVTGNFGYTHSELTDFVDPFTAADHTGNITPYVPRFNLNVAGIYRHPLGFFARSDVIWTGKTYFDAANSQRFLEQDYIQLNASAGYRHHYFEIVAYGKNLTKTEYFTSKLPAINMGNPGEPLTFGFQAAVKF